MRFAYSAWDDALARQIASLKSLHHLFFQLLLRTQGDVEEAFRWLEYLQEQGHLPPDWDLEAFRREMEKEGIVGGEEDTSR